MIIFLGGDDQTKRSDVASRCGGDVDALTSGVPPRHTVVGAISAHRHGCGRNTEINYSQKGFWGLVRFCVGNSRKGKGQISIMQYDLNGNFIKEWESATVAEKDLGISIGKINMVCRKKRNKAGGYIWSYK